MNIQSKGARLRELMNRKDKVLTVLHPPTAVHGRIMERAGCEVGFVGTGGVVGAYTGLADVGTLTMMECVQIAGWIAQAVKFPIIMDGDTGHGGVMAVRRLVRECIRAGIAGIRIDDQPLEGKRRTQSAGMEVVPLEQAIARYRAAVDMKNELDPDFVIMAQCYARDAANSSLDDAIARLKAYREIAGVDWVQLESPHSVEEIRLARAAVEGPFSFMKGKLPRFLGLDEHLALGVNIAWYPGFTHAVTWAALWDFMQDFQGRGIAAWEDFVASRKDRPYPEPFVGPEGEGADKQRMLEERYLSPESLGKYKSLKRPLPPLHMAIYTFKMDISVTEFKQRCLEIIRRVEETGKPVTLTRRGKAVARLQAPLSAAAAADLKPWVQLRAMGGRLLAEPGESVLSEEDFEALR